MRPLVRFLALSILFHLVLLAVLQLTIKTPEFREDRPLLVEVLPPPKPKEVKPPEKAKVLSDVSRKVKKESRQRDIPSPRVVRPAATPAPSPPEPAPPPLPEVAAREIPAPTPKPEPPKEEPPKEKPPAPAKDREREKTEKPKAPEKAKITLPKVSLEEKTEITEVPPPSPAPEIRRAPSLAEEITNTIMEERPKEVAPPPKAEERPREVASLPKKPDFSSLLRPKGLPPLSRLIPTPERLEKLPSLRREGSTANVVREEIVSLNTTDFKYYSYFVKLKSRIENIWGYPLEARRQGQHGQLFMEFSIRRDGTLEGIRLVRSSYFPILDEEALRAVRVALKQPLPLPSAWGLDRLRVRASFIYYLNNWIVR